MSDDYRDLALAYLGQCNVMTLATYGPEGLWAAAVFYASQEFALYYLSAGHTRHSLNIAANPRVAATIQKDYAGWQEIRGIQLEGDVQQLAGAAREQAVARYLAKYPFITEADPEVWEALQAVNWYRLTPRRLYLIDNSRGLGRRAEIRLGAV
jgi:uncharacterized protein YhbP (UPF0306 family)